MRDFYPDWGIHQGYMPAFAEATGVDLDAVFGYYAKLAGSEKLKGLSGNDKLTRCTDAIETLRSHFSLNDLIETEKEITIAKEAEADISELLDSIFKETPAQLDVFFELLEWNVAGPRNEWLFQTMLDRFLPDELWSELTLSSERTKWTADIFTKLTNHMDVD